jgi:hypothetical protein
LNLTQRWGKRARLSKVSKCAQKPFYLFFESYSLSQNYIFSTAG